MPINDVVDIAYGSGNPSKTGSPMQPGPTIAPFQQGYVENSVTPAVLGKLVRLFVNASNVSVNTVNTTSGGAKGGALAQQAAVAGEVFLSGECGIVTQAAAAQNMQGVFVYQGIAYALCTTTTTAIAVGTLLAADAAGNLTPAPGSPTPGQIIARSYGTLATNTTTPTLVPVWVGVS
jgi:hypothetical protein